MKNITIWTTPTCKYCKMAKKFFDDNNLIYKEIDVTEDKYAAREMIAKSKQMGVPVIQVDEVVVVGFDKKNLEKLLF